MHIPSSSYDFSPTMMLILFMVFVLLVLIGSGLFWGGRPRQASPGIGITGFGLVMIGVMGALFLSLMVTSEIGHSRELLHRQADGPSASKRTYHYCVSSPVAPGVVEVADGTISFVLDQEFPPTRDLRIVIAADAKLKPGRPFNITSLTRIN